MKKYTVFGFHDLMPFPFVVVRLTKTGKPWRHIASFDCIATAASVCKDLNRHA